MFLFDFLYWCVWAQIYYPWQICWSLNCEERLPVLVSAFSGSVFLGVLSTKVVLLLINSSTWRNLRLLCFGVTFLISSSRYEWTKALGKFVILKNEVQRRNENQSPWQICRKKLFRVLLLMSFWSLLVSRTIGVLMRLQNLIPTLAKLRIYKSFILPRLTYCPTVLAHNSVFIPEDGYLLFCKSGGKLASKLPLVSI